MQNIIDNYKICFISKVKLLTRPTFHCKTYVDGVYYLKKLYDYYHLGLLNIFILVTRHSYSQYAHVC